MILDRVLMTVLVGIASVICLAPGGPIPGGGYVSVPAGETGTNGAVTVVNSSQQNDSNAKAKIFPKDHNAGVPDKVTTDPDFAGTITGTGPNDEVNLGNDSGDPNVQTLVYGTGGSVNITGADSNVTVVNMNTDPQGPTITVTDPDGTHTVFPNGSFSYPHQ